MLAKFDVTLRCEKDFYNMNMGSLFHGAFMELIPTEYAETLHQNDIQPFSQSIESCDDGIVWHIRTLDNECREYISGALMDKRVIEIKDKKRKLEVVSVSSESISYRNFIENTYFSESSDLFRINFITPTTFKKNGKYIIYPDINAMYKNIIRKFDAFSNEFDMYDEDTVDMLTDNSQINSYRLQSVYYSMESVRIPSYKGWIRLKVSAPKKMCSLVNLLVKYSEYSGIGVKTALGMGCVRTEEVHRGGKK